MAARAGPLEGWLLYITNHYTHPVREAQMASPRYHLARKLAERGQRLVVYCPLGRHVGNPIEDFVANLWPKRVVQNNAVYLFPPVIVSPASATTVMTLVMGTAFILAFLVLTRIKVVAQYSTTILVGSVGAVLKKTMGIPLVANYGDPDFAREHGLSRKAFRFCENLVLSKSAAYAAIYLDEVIGEYIRSGFQGLHRLVFLPNGGYERGERPLPADDDSVVELRRRLQLEGKTVVVYAGQVSSGYRIDVLVPAAAEVVRRLPQVVFLIIGNGSSLASLAGQVKAYGLERSFRLVGPVPYSAMSRYLALSTAGLQLLGDMCMGTKVLMYMANRIPVISVGGWYDRYGEFLRSGENTLLVPPDSGRLASSITELLQDSDGRTDMIAAAWESVKPYSWDHHADVTLSLLREAVERPGPRGSDQVTLSRHQVAMSREIRWRGKTDQNPRARVRTPHLTRRM